MATLTLQQKNLLTHAKPDAEQRAELGTADHDLNGKVTGVFADYHYVGTGDTLERPRSFQ